ncbi:MAG: hypothetical protein AB1705_22635 [Verrucomicrobiota bacterium]
MALNTGSYLTRKLVTGRLLFKRAGANTFMDFGNVVMHKQESSKETVKIKQARKGYVETIHERPIDIEHRWSVSLDEQLDDSLRLQLLATVASADQASAASQSESFTGVAKGNVIKLAKRNVSNVVVEVATVAKTLNVDYTLDAEAGLITILRTGTIADASTVDVDYDAGAATIQRFTSNEELIVKGDALLDEYDQHSDLPRGRVSFSGQIMAKDYGDNDGKKASQFTVELLATGPITYDKRVDTE